MENPISEYIKNLRKQLGLNQQDFGELIGASRSNIAKYESNKMWGTTPPGNILLKIQELERNHNSQ